MSEVKRSGRVGTVPKLAPLPTDASIFDNMITKADGKPSPQLIWKSPEVPPKQDP